MPGTVNAASPAAGSVGRQDVDRTETLRQRLGDLTRVSRGPNAGTVDAAAAAVDVDALRHQVDVLLPAIHHVIPQQDLGKPGAVGLHAGIAAILLHGRQPAEDHGPRRGGQHGGTRLGSPGIDRKNLARHTRGNERRDHAIGRPRFLRTRLEHQAELQRNRRQPQRVDAG